MASSKFVFRPICVTVRESSVFTGAVGECRVGLVCCMLAMLRGPVTFKQYCVWNRRVSDVLLGELDCCTGGSEPSIKAR